MEFKRITETAVTRCAYRWLTRERGL